MKKLSLLFLVCTGLFFNSCEDATNIIQDGEFSEAATFRTVADMQLFLYEVYDRASVQNEIGFTAIMTDEAAVGNQNAGQDKDLYGFVLNSNDGYADGIWAGQYNMINYANRLLRGAARVTPEPGEEAEYNSIIAQAKALRAFGHFELLAYYSTNMADDNALGVILMDRVPGIAEELPRNTNGEVFALIESDLDFAYNNIIDPTAAVVNAKPWTFLSKNAINALRARMYLYRGNYTLALQYANQVIADSPALTIATPVPAGVVGSTAWNNSFYSATAPANPYRKMLADFERGEIIWSLDRPAGKGSVAGLFYFNRTNFTGGCYHDMSRNMFNILEGSVPPTVNNASNSSDIRRFAYIDPTSKIDQPGYSTYTPANGDYTTDASYQLNDALLIDKYPGKSGADLNSDLKVFRVSEMYFIRAEALVAAGDLAGAAVAIKAVRDARTFRAPFPVLPVYANATAALTDILLERRLELAFEGHRYLDLKRLGAATGQTIDRYVRDCETVPTCSIANGDYRFTMPIPIAEMNTNAQIQQNPGYDE
ncbi:RagB/SusD family nutrient uptake outer membrane protein [Flavobacterium terrisoli]|uniref:RagB/SusD family nutrient uptake outer membrane protein n=1 Tax=Flavobacterium terrisoli TaxID=3242195 RepID=UPI002542E87B|nr:RagB/SusD family nutrient uptake outer membrane protein [Flavobacterium buctense]